MPIPDPEGPGGIPGGARHVARLLRDAVFTDQHTHFAGYVDTSLTERQAQFFLSHARSEYIITVACVGGIPGL